MTVAFLPLALVILPVENLPLVATVLGFATVMPAAYAAFVNWGGVEHGISLRQVLAYVGLHLAYVAVLRSACSAAEKLAAGRGGRSR